MFPEKFVRNFSRLFHCSIIKVLRPKSLCFRYFATFFKKLFSRSSAINTLSHFVVFVNTFFSFFFVLTQEFLSRQQVIYYQISPLLSTLIFTFSQLNTTHPQTSHWGVSEGVSYLLYKPQFHKIIHLRTIPVPHLLLMSELHPLLLLSLLLQQLLLPCFLLPLPALQSLVLVAQGCLPDRCEA